MKRLFSLILVGMLAVSGLSAKVKLSVLYVGGTANMDPMLMAPGSVDSVALAASVKERMAHFTKFLKKNFTNVKSIEGKDYTPEMSAAYDVTVFDGRTVPFRKGDRMKGERDSYLPESFDRAAVMIGHMSEDLGRSLGNKNDWYCLCLDNYALGMKNDHPVFNGPFKVDMTTEMRPTAAPALEVAEMMGESLPKEMPMLLMHPNWTEEENASGNCRIGMVSRPGGYLDSPDTEVISGGLCGKSIDAVAHRSPRESVSLRFCRRSRAPHSRRTGDSAQFHCLCVEVQRTETHCAQNERRNRHTRSSADDKMGLYT